MFLTRLLLCLGLFGSVQSASAQITPDAPPTASPAQPMAERPPPPPPAGLAAAARPSRYRRPDFTFSVIGAGSFQYIVETPFLSGGVELRLGLLTRKVEVTARLRMLAGSTIAGLLLLEPSVSLGVMFPIDDRVRIGMEITAPPFVRSMNIHYATHDSWGKALLVGAGFETSIDIVKWEGNRALFWVGTLGVDVTSVRATDSSQQSAAVGPNLFTGIGYRI